MKLFLITKIQDMLLNLDGFLHASYLDLNMGHYQIEVSPGSKQLCTILLPWVKYEYQNHLWDFLTAPISSRKIYPNYLRGLIC